MTLAERPRRRPRRHARWFWPAVIWILALGVAAATWVMAGVVLFALKRWREAPRGKRYPFEMLGMLLAHFGIAVFVVGALLVESLSIQHEVALAPGQTMQVGAYELRFESVEASEGPNYHSDRGHVRVFRGDREIALLHPEKRKYASGGMPMTEAGIHPALGGDVYVALGESLGNGAWAVRVQVKPFVRWIWLGALLMALGGFVTAIDRRFRKLPGKS